MGESIITMGITQEGIDGEQKLFAFLKEKGVKFFQADAIGLNKDKYELYEVKHQERFKAPPFDGHGLPRWQIDARLKFQQQTGIRCVFVVFDKETQEIFYGYLDRLNIGQHHDTHGLKPRRIFPISSFMKADDTKREPTVL